MNAEIIIALIGFLVFVTVIVKYIEKIYCEEMQRLERKMDKKKKLEG